MSGLPTGAPAGVTGAVVKVRKKPGPKPGTKRGPTRSKDGAPRKKPGPKPGSKRTPKKGVIKPVGGKVPASGQVTKRAAVPKPAEPKKPKQLKVAAGEGGAPAGTSHLNTYPQEQDDKLAQAIADRPLTNHRVEDLVVFTLACNTYVHTIQAERGASTAYVSSQGKVLSAILRELRGESDAALQKLKQTRLFREVSAEFDKAAVVGDFRKKVDFLQMTYLEVMGGYNMLVESLIESICRVVVPLHQINMGMAVGSYVSFMFLKDKVGVERATVGGLLSDLRGMRLDESAHLALVANLGSQKAFVRSFMSSGISEAVRTEFVMLHMDIPPQIGELERELVISRESAYKVLKSFTPEDWFQMMTGRMNALDKIQKLLAAEIRNTALSYVSVADPQTPDADSQGIIHDENHVFEVLSRIESEDLMLPLDWTVRMANPEASSQQILQLPTSASLL